MPQTCIYAAGFHATESCTLAGVVMCTRGQAFFMREADNKNKYVNKKPGEQAHRNISRTKLDDGNCRWRKALGAVSRECKTRVRTEESEKEHFCPLGERAVAHTLLREPRAAISASPRRRRPSPAPQADVASGFGPPPPELVCLHSALSANPVPNAGSPPPPPEMPRLTSQSM